jgi:WXG100 family type VII secretion target
MAFCEQLNLIYVDLDQLAKAKNAYSQAAVNLNDAKNKADKAIQTLKSSKWKSDAANEFFKLYDGTWSSNIAKHIRIIDHLEMCLEKAKAEYEAIYIELCTLERSI